MKPPKNPPRSRRGELTARQIEMPFVLAERPRTVRELVEHFGVSEKTIRRTLDAISSYYNITEERDGREIRYRFRDDYEFKPPALAPSELASLLLARESIAATGLTADGAPFAHHARTLLQKVRATLPASLRDRLDALALVYGSSAIAAKDFSAHTDTIERLTTAALERRAVKILYYSLNRDRTEQRTFEPYNVYFDPDGATLKVIGYDHTRRAIIPLSIDHIRALRLTADEFTRPADFNLREHLIRNCFNGIHGEPLDVRLRAHGIAARLFAERTFHPSQRIIEQTPATEDQAETTTITMRVARGRGLLRFILSWTPDLEVLSPPELKHETDAALRSALTRFGAAGSESKEVTHETTKQKKRAKNPKQTKNLRRKD